MTVQSAFYECREFGQKACLCQPLLLKVEAPRVLSNHELVSEQRAERKRRREEWEAQALPEAVELSRKFPWLPLNQIEAHAKAGSVPKFKSRPKGR